MGGAVERDQLEKAITEALGAKEGRESIILKLFDGEVEGLQAKVQETLKEKKKLADRLKVFDGIDPEEHKSMAEELEALRAGSGKDVESAVQRATGKLQKELEKTGNLLLAEKAAVNRLLIDNGLTASLAAVGVTEAGMRFVKAAFIPQAVVESDGDERVAVIGGKPLQDAVKEWAKTDEAKLFIRAQASSGGGANGGAGGGSVSAKTMKKSAFGALSPQDRMAFMKSGGTLIDE
jgi:hypothetical protein